MDIISKAAVADFEYRNLQCNPDQNQDHSVFIDISGPNCLAKWKHWSLPRCIKSSNGSPGFRYDPADPLPRTYLQRGRRCEVIWCEGTVVRILQSRK